MRRLVCCLAALVLGSQSGAASAVEATTSRSALGVVVVVDKDQGVAQAQGAAYRLCACSARAGQKRDRKPARRDTYANLVAKKPSVDSEVASASSGQTAAWGFGYIDVGRFGRRAWTYELKAVAIVLVAALEGGPTGGAVGRAADPVVITGADTHATMRLTLQPGTRIFSADPAAVPASLGFGVSASSSPSPIAEVRLAATGNGLDAQVRLAAVPGVAFVDDDGAALSEDSLRERLQRLTALADVDGLLREESVLTVQIDLAAAGLTELQIGTFVESRAGSGSEAGDRKPYGKKHVGPERSYAP